MLIMNDQDRRGSQTFRSGALNLNVKSSPENTRRPTFETLNFNPGRCVPGAHVTFQHVPETGHSTREKVVLSPDDGYGTDSRSNTTASISSPLSSSLSSLSTYEGSPVGAGMNPSGHPFYQDSNSVSHYAIQRPPIEKGPSVLVMSRSGMNKHAGLHAKRRDIPPDSPDTTPSNLEDRLRALTTIEEEDGGYPDRSRGRLQRAENYSGDTLMKLSHSLTNSPRDSRYNRRGFEDREFDSPVLDTSGYFRAVPVQVGDPRGRLGDSTNQQDDNSTPSRSFVPHPASPLANGDGWKDYTTYFQKDSGIPPHNIDPAGRGKFTNASVDDVPDMDINRQIGMGPGNNLKKQPRFSGVLDSPRAKHVFPHGESVPAVNHGEDQGVSSHDYQQIVAKPHAAVQANGLGLGSRQARVMSSMPDLRASDSARWRQNLTSTQFQTSGFSPAQLPQQHSTNPHLMHDLYRQEQESPQPSGRPPQTFNLPESHHYHQPQQQTQRQTQQHQSHRYFNLQPQYASAIDVSNAGGYLGNAEDDPSYPEVVLRRARLAATPSTAPPRLDRYSWQPESLSASHAETNVDGRLKNVQERASLDLGSIPQLQKQIRATSELCLQASRRHMFASSADIYQLFSGQVKPPIPSSPSLQRHSLTSDLKSSLSSHTNTILAANRQESPRVGNVYQNEVSSLQNTPRMKPKLRLTVPSLHLDEPSIPSHYPSRAGPPLNIPPKSWIETPGVAQDVKAVNNYLDMNYEPSPIRARSSLPSDDYVNLPRPHSTDPEMNRLMDLYRPAGYDPELERPSAYHRRPSFDAVPERTTQQMYELGPARELQQRTQSCDTVIHSHFTSRSYSNSMTVNDRLNHPPRLPDNAAASDGHRVRQRPPSADIVTDKPHHHRSSSGFEPTWDKPMFQRQSSGYSSETELQQIEYNAVRGGRHLQANPDYGGQEFVPLDRSLDSNTCTDQTNDCSREEEPVYVNLSRHDHWPIPQPGEAYHTPEPAYSSINKRHSAQSSNSTSLNIGGFHPVTNKHHLTFQSNYLPAKVDYSDDSSKLTTPNYSNPHLEPSPHIADELNQRSTAATKQKAGTALFPDTAITQKQVINFNKKPLTITSVVPQSPFTYENVGTPAFNVKPTHSNNISDGVVDSNARPKASYPLTPHVTILQDHPVGVDHSAGPIRPSGQPVAIHAHPSGRHHTHQVSPVELARALGTPFATNIISDEQGDRLSTLV